MSTSTVSTFECDRCHLEETVAGDVPAPTGWFLGLMSMNLELAERHVCPSCMAGLLDPPDDVTSELRRFDLEGRIA